MKADSLSLSPEEYVEYFVTDEITKKHFYSLLKKLDESQQSVDDMRDDFEYKIEDMKDLIDDLRDHIKGLQDQIKELKNPHPSYY